MFDLEVDAWHALEWDINEDILFYCAADTVVVAWSRKDGRERLRSLRPGSAEG